MEEQKQLVKDVYPDRAQYRPGEKGNIVLELSGSQAGSYTIFVEFSEFHHIVWMEKISLQLEEGQEKTVLIPFESPHSTWACFGVDIKILKDQTIVGEGSTAFDVADHWKRAPRYGFISDFKKDEEGNLSDVDCINKYHINIVQFYDWMYRHDDLIPPQDQFIDPMGRELSYAVVKEKQRACHEKGMATMAYGAVYASLPDYHETHQEMGLYKNNGEPHHLGNIFYIMDISPDSPWSDKIISEFRRVIEEGFDGIHMDQYGFPKKAWRMVGGKKELVDLAKCFPELINRTKAELKKVNPEIGLIFNNVSNYPVETTATADQEAVYIEVWPPVVKLKELKGLIDRARELSSGKPVILSAYLPSFKPGENRDAVSAENGALLTMATIFASSGYHLLLGEDNKVLTEAYYPGYSAMRETFIREVRNYYDFIVRYGKLLYDPALMDLSMTYTGGINTEISFKGDAEFAPNGDPGKVWTIVKELPDYQIIHLINLVGVENDDWEWGKKERPKQQKNIECIALFEKEVKGIYFASPDHPSSIRPVRLDFEIVDHMHGRAVRFVIPELSVWSMVYMELETEGS